MSSSCRSKSYFVMIEASAVATACVSDFKLSVQGRVPSQREGGRGDQEICLKAKLSLRMSVRENFSSLSAA